MIARDKQLEYSDNLDAWDGYFMEREQLYSVLAEKKVVVLAGEIYNAWFDTLKMLREIVSEQN